MNTEKTHERFWDAMRARFGMRWITEFGDKPTAPWINLLNQYKPNELKAALELMVQEKLQHPPTLPIFEALLKKAASKHQARSVDYVRGYWRSVIVSVCTDELRFNGTLPDDGFEPYLIQHKADLGESMRSILDELCDMELKTGARNPGLSEFALSQGRKLIAAHLSDMRRAAA